ncbi:MAG: heparinase II/III family protein [Proteobacteria bacterium]|nr:heparinase II/III family protein [Pseudomonadota bacterium]
MRDRLLVLAALIAGCHCSGTRATKTDDQHATIRNGKPGPGGGDRACAGDVAAAQAASAAPAEPTPPVPNGTFAPTAAHPRLWWTPERLARARAWIARTGFVADDEDILDNAFVYAVTRNPEAGKIALAFLRKVVAEDTFQSSDNARWHGEYAIAIYDWCFDLIPAGERAAFVAYANRWFASWNADEWGGVGHEEGNYYWGNLRNGLEWGLVSGPENPMAASFLENALVTRWQKSFLPYAQGLQKGGVPTEGTQYGRYQEGYLLMPFVTLQTGGRKIFDETDWFRGAVYYNIHQALPGPTIRDGKAVRDAFSHEDDEFWHNGESGIDPEYGDFMTAMAWSFPDKQVGQHARWWLGASGVKRSHFVEASDAGVVGKATDLTTIPLDYYAPGVGYLWARDAWRSASTVVFAQLGYARGAGHQHLDAGGFQIWRHGRWLSRETTAYVDEIVGYAGVGRAGARETIGHNGILFGGKGSALGYFDGFPVVTRLESRKDYTYAATELSKFYRASTSNHVDRDDNPYAGSLVRELFYLRGQDVVVVFDRVASSSASLTRDGFTGAKLPADQVAKAFLLHFEQTAKVTTTATPTGSSTLAVNGDQALRVQTLLPAKPTVRLIDERLAKDDRIGQQRLEIETSGSAETYFLHVLHARDASGPGSKDVDAALVPTATGWNLTITGGQGATGTTTIALARGMKSTGGTIATPGCAAHALADYVQNIRVTDDGPIWGP